MQNNSKKIITLAIVTFVLLSAFAIGTIDLITRLALPEWTNIVVLISFIFIGISTLVIIIKNA